ncbi:MULTISPECIES: arylamine N-acetyltransferase [unclassified Streptomyces]|uniref:arylamine N-acetyltransferase family protein n=1 Tax=unclassified Streptomyces TaxID=2593676 RepID=UPI002E0F2FD4|nr:MULTISPECIES: arylamine N-acetyltransferase [unclassified Streptomyces]WSR27043.1 arylamine N-acetyltransferase [Streptomyces sp. NBC_01205]
MTEERTKTMLSDAMVDAYLERIGARRPEKADIHALRHLQERHVLSVPFENIDYHVEGAELGLEREFLYDKIVTRRRGGGCYELNPSFGHLLEALGFSVEILAGQVFLGGAFGAPLCHLALRVRLEDQDWLVDVGFGKNSRFPLQTASAEVQKDPHGAYQVTRPEEGFLQVHLNGNVQYRLDERPVRIGDFYPTLWWYRSAPDSVFLHNLICSMQNDAGRVTVNGRELTRTDENGTVTTLLADDAALRAAYEENFGIVIDPAAMPKQPDVDPAIRIIMQID